MDNKTHRRNMISFLMANQAVLSFENRDRKTTSMPAFWSIFISDKLPFDDQEIRYEEGSCIGVRLRKDGFTIGSIYINPNSIMEPKLYHQSKEIALEISILLEEIKKDYQ